MSEILSKRVNCTHIFDPLTAVVDADGREVCPICFEIGNLRQRIKALEAIVRDIEPDYAAYPSALRCNLCGKWTPTEGSPLDFDGVPLHKACCIYVRAQEALRGQHHD